jgi:hypothetical protein
MLLFKAVHQWVLFCSLALLAVIPFHSSDLYGYLNRGFQQSLLHTNPYLTPVADIPGWMHEPSLHAHWIHNPCPYGFLFAQWAAWLTRLAGGHFVLAFFLFKITNVLALLGATALIYRIANQLKRPQPWRDAFWFGANPLILLHAIGNGHNDILLAFLLLLSLCFLLSNRWSWLALPVLTLSVLTKYASLLAFPFMGLYLIKQRNWKALLSGGLLSFILLIALALPYVDMQQSWPWNALLDNAGKPQHSLIAMLSRAAYYSAKWVVGMPKAEELMEMVQSLLKPAFWTGFVLFYGWRLWQFFRQPLQAERLLLELGLVLTVMVAFVSAKFHPWYPVMFLPILVLLPKSSTLRRFGLLFSLFLLAAFTPLLNLHVINVLLLTLMPLGWVLRRPNLLAD